LIAFAKFFALVIAGLAAIAALGYPVWSLLTPTFDFPFHRVASRVAMLAVLLGFVWLARRERLADRSSLGYGLPRRRWLSEAAKAFLLGAATMLPVMVVMLLAGMRVLQPGLELDAALLAKLAASGVASGLTVALIEETFLRGAMFTAIARESGPRLAIVLPSLLYAATHFIGRYRIPADQVDAGSGLELLRGMLQQFANFGAIFDAFLSLFAVGVLLALVRHLTGNIAACVGLHAGWVWIILCMRATTAPAADHPAAFLLSTFDGVVGWLVFGWTILLGVWLFRFYDRRQKT
jgi:membrane protease YdiL (CAAX protease family)